MRRYIDADSLLTKIKAYRPYMYLGEDALSYAIKMVELEPSADVRENVRGEWIKGQELSKKDIKRPYLFDWYYCSQCKEEAYCDTDYGQQLFDFCPNCGAQMRGDKT